MKLIYIAGPYSASTEKEREENVHVAMAYGSLIKDTGRATVIPHLSHYVDKVFPKLYEDWIKIDLEILSRCDELFRIPGASKGADIEVAFAKKHGIKIYYSLSEILNLT